MKNEEFTLEVVQFLQEDFVPVIKTTHILILDYVFTILSFAEKHYGYTFPDQVFERVTEINWQEDADCRQEVTGDGRATWGYGPVHMDFAKYVIGPIASHSHRLEEMSTPTLKECLAMVIWRMKSLGYSEEVFAKLDNEIESSDRNLNRFDNSEKIERYAKKYSWIAYFELYGHFIRCNFLKPEYNRGLRVDGVDIDPSFPSKPQKVQLVNACYIPAEEEVVQEWIKKDYGPYLQQYYINSLLKNGYEWVMLYGRLEQEGRGKTKFSLIVDTVLKEKRNLGKDAKIFQSNSFRLSAIDYSYVFGGEIPWSDYLKSPEECKGPFIRPYSWYGWGEQRSKYNNTGNVPFVDEIIAQSLDLNFEPTTMSYMTPDNTPATILLWDNYSMYLFMRKDLLLKYLQTYNLTVLFIEQVSKYGDFGESETKLNPSFSDFQYITEIR